MTLCKRTCMTGRFGLARFFSNTVVHAGSLLLVMLAAMPAYASIAREGTEVIEDKLSGSGIQSGRMSWFGQYGYGRYSDGLHRHVWRDSGDNGLNASGLAQMVPGIALMERRTLGHWFEVELNGRVFLVRQVDIGPHPRTGRKIDINAPLSDMAGYTPRNFPTDRVIRWRHVGSPQQMLAMRQQQKPQLKQLALLDQWGPGMSDQPRLAYDLVSPAVQQDTPNLTRATAKRAPWLAAAPRTVELLTSPRHWASADKSARRTLEQTLIESKPQRLPESLPEPLVFASLPGDLVAVDRAPLAQAAPKPPIRTAAARKLRPQQPRVIKATYAAASLEMQVLMPILRAFGFN